MNKLKTLVLITNKNKHHSTKTNILASTIINNPGVFSVNLCVISILLTRISLTKQVSGIIIVANTFNKTINIIIYYSSD